MTRIRLGARNWRTLSMLGTPSCILLTVSKPHRRLLVLGLCREITGGGLAITPAGLRALADAIEAGVVKDAQALTDERRADGEAAGG